MEVREGQAKKQRSEGNKKPGLITRVSTNKAKKRIGLITGIFCVKFTIGDVNGAGNITKIITGFSFVVESS